MHILQFWVSGVRISPLSPMETQRNTKILRPTTGAVCDADGEGAQTWDLSCFVSVSQCVVTRVISETSIFGGDYVYLFQSEKLLSQLLASILVYRRLTSLLLSTWALTSTSKPTAPFVSSL